MPAFFAQLFHPAADSEDATRKHLLWWILLRIVIICILCGMGALARGRVTDFIVPPLPQTSLFLMLVSIFSIASAVCLQYCGLAGAHLHVFGLAQLWSDAFFVSVGVYATGCSESIFTPLFLLPIIATGLILRKTGGLSLAALSTLLYALVLYSETRWEVPDYFLETNYVYKRPNGMVAFLNLFPFYGLVFFLAALISGQMGARLHHAQKALRETARAYERLNRLYRQIFNDISSGIITTDAEHRINSYNQAAAAITGRPEANVLGELLEVAFPEMAASLTDSHARNACDFVKPDGETIRIGYSSAPLRLGEEEDKKSPARVITMADISRLERMERQVREAEKLAAIGEMSARIAHDFRNPLAAISGSAQMLTADAEGAAATLAGIIQRETMRMEKTIADFLIFARPHTPDRQWFQLRPVLEDQMARIMAENPLMAQVTTVNWDVPVDLRGWADQRQIGAILSQLVENAWMATKETATTVLIRARRETEGGRDTLVLEVCDQGPGIPPELREQVFAPFFSNRAKGTGLGLAIVRQIAQQHEGAITMTEEPDYPCVVRITLPQPGV